MSATGGVTACILAGGQGRRLGGIDKGLMEWRGRPLIETLLTAISPQVDAVLINANRNQARYRVYGHPVIGDELAGYQGPLAGIAACMAASNTETIVTLPCDAPGLPRDYVARLVAARNAGRVPIAVAHDGERLQPVHALLSVVLLPGLQAYLSGDERAARAWYARCGCIAVDFSDSRDCFFNINRPADRQRAPAGETQ